MEKKKIIDVVIIGLSVLFVIGIVGYASPLVISPIDGLKTTNSSVLFEFEKADTILIDDNIEFTSPILINAENNLVVNLLPGEYYWKIKGLGESRINTLTIISEVDLKLKENGDKYSVVNAGNTELKVDIYNGSVLQGNVVLEVDEEHNSTGTLFVGRENNG